MALKPLPVQTVGEATKACPSFPSRVKSVFRIKQKGLSHPEGGALAGTSLEPQLLRALTTNPH